MTIIPLIRWILLFTIFIITLHYFWNEPNVWENLVSISPYWLMLILFVKLGVALINGIKLLLSLEAVKLQPTFTEWFGLSIATTLFSYTLPFRTSIIPRLYYLKKQYSLGYLESSTLTVGVNFLDTIVTALSAIVVTLLFFDTENTSVLNLVYGFSLAGLIIISLSSVILIGSHRVLKTGWSSLQKKIDRVRHAILLLTKNIRCLFLIIVFILASLIARTLALYICYHAVNYPADFTHIYVAVCLVSLTIVVSLTPGNIGVTESALVLVTSIVGIPIDYSALAVIISRASSMIVQFTFGGYYATRLFGSWHPRDVSNMKNTNIQS